MEFNQDDLTELVKTLNQGHDDSRAELLMREAAQAIGEMAAVLLRVENTAKSMSARAADNPQGIQAETLEMFAQELVLALRP